MKALALILALAPSTLLAQDLPERLANAPNISFEDWRTMTAGKTVIYEIDGITVGYESYLGEGKVNIRVEDGSCIEGIWYMEQSAFCFDWQDGPLNCFNHKRLDDTIYVIGLDNGAETTDIQRVSRIANIPVSCGPLRLSSLFTAVHP